MTLVARIQEKLTPDLLKPGYDPQAHPYAGHCYVASEALYHLWGKENGYTPHVIRHEGGTHWYLQHELSGHVVDPTREQFKAPVPYDEGRGCGFLTRKPSKRTQTLLERMQ